MLDSTREKRSIEKMVELQERGFEDGFAYDSPNEERNEELDPRWTKVTFEPRPTKPVYRTAYYRNMKMQVYNFLERPSNMISIIYHSFVFFLIVTSLSLSVLSTVKKFEGDPSVETTVYILEVVLVAVFSVEYLLRLWSCSSHGTYSGFWGRMKFIKKPYMVIDIIVIVATSVVIGFQGKSDLVNISIFRFLRFVQVLRILRLDRQRGAFKMVSQVVYEHRQELLTCWYMSFIILVTCSFLVYLAERTSQPQSGKMENLAEGIYWGIISLLTIGYGDIAPQTWVAKIITCVFSLFGTAFFALPAGILGSGFALQVAQQQRQKHFNRRRIPAARVIQAAWRKYAAETERYPATWLPLMAYQAKRRLSSVRDLSKTPPASPFVSNKRIAFMKRKNAPNGSNHSLEVGTDVERDVPAAAVPLAVYLRERCQSEGNLVIGDSNNIDQNQDTVISLPGKTFWNGYRKKSRTNPELLVELTCTEKNVVRFLRLVNLVISLRKFREARRPYDVKDVIEQYSEGQMEMFGHIKKLQSRLETAIGFKGRGDKDLSKMNLLGRLNSVETKVETLDAKLDLVIRLLRESKGHRVSSTRSSHNNSPSPSDITSTPPVLKELKLKKCHTLDDSAINYSDHSREQKPKSSPDKSCSRFKVTLLEKGDKPVDL